MEMRYYKGTWIEWANKWKMEFNVEKCKIMHLGKANPKHTYTMGGVELAETTVERDLGVLVDNCLEFDKHIKAIVNKANRMMGLIRLGFFMYGRGNIYELIPCTSETLTGILCTSLVSV